MSKPTKHYGKWRIRWIDEHGQRQSAVLDEFKTAVLVLRQKELEADERRRGLRDPAPTERTVDDIAESRNGVADHTRTQSDCPMSVQGAE